MAELFSFVLGLAAFYSIYQMLALSLNLEYGYGGLPNFGKVMFSAGGAFITGSLLTRLIALAAGVPPDVIWDVSKFRVYNTLLATKGSSYLATNPLLAIAFFALMLVLGAGVGGLLGILASYPAIRLREDYLGVTLIVSGELLRIMARNYEPLVCGTLGVSVPNLFAWAGAYSELAKVSSMLVISTLTLLLVDRMLDSPYGRVLRAMRGNEVAAASLGKDVTLLKIETLAVGSAIAGAAGSMYAIYLGAVVADEFTPLKTFITWLMVVMGGAGNNAGACLGALTYISIDRILTLTKHVMPLPFDVNYLQHILTGIILVLLLMYRPEGILSERAGEIRSVSRVVPSGSGGG